jgi:hypothetical protein
MLALDPDGFSLRWYEDMIWGTKNPWGLATKNSLILLSLQQLDQQFLEQLLH